MRGPKLHCMFGICIIGGSVLCFFVPEIADNEPQYTVDRFAAFLLLIDVKISKRHLVVINGYLPFLLATSKILKIKVAK